jgi:microcystin-dependent protein
MSEPFVAEIRIFASNFAPKGWAFCNGQLMPISQNTALFSLLGTTYGGDGKSNFALPDMQGRAPMHPGSGPGLSLRDLGENGGSASVTLTTSEIPSHTHGLQASSSTATSSDPTGHLLASPAANPKFTSLYSGASGSTSLSASALSTAGGGLPHNNLQPYLALSFIIALQGVFPPRN